MYSDMIRTTFSPPPKALVLLLALSGCLLRDPFTDAVPIPPPEESLPTLPPGPSLGVLVMGDWGTGGEGQREVAEAMASVHGNAPPDFVLTVGDNFYPDGVKGTSDSLWRTHFENMYAGSFWDSMPFQAILGNHDHSGDPDAQLAYSRVSSRWSMPARHYAFQKEIPGGGTALFIALDTEPMERRDSTAAHQLAWADSILRGSSADWVVAAGHRPFATGGWHRPSRTLEEDLLPVLAGRVHLYVSGHNHSLELLRLQDGSLQAVCGGGGGLDNAYRVKRTDETLTSFTNGGWCFLRFWPKAMAVDLYDRKGGLQYRYLIGG